MRKFSQFFSLFLVLFGMAMANYGKYELSMFCIVMANIGMLMEMIHSLEEKIDAYISNDTKPTK